MPKWTTRQAVYRLLVATFTVFGEEGLKGKYREIASVYGQDATYDSVQSFCRGVWKDASDLRVEMQQPRRRPSRDSTPNVHTVKPMKRRISTVNLVDDLDSDDWEIIEQGAQRSTFPRARARATAQGRELQEGVSAPKRAKFGNHTPNLTFNSAVRTIVPNKEDCQEIPPPAKSLQVQAETALHRSLVDEQDADTSHMSSPSTLEVSSSFGDPIVTSSRTNGDEQDLLHLRTRDTQNGVKGLQNDNAPRKKRNERNKAPASYASAQFRKAFPHGFSVIPTSGKGLHCGIYAITETMRAMHPEIRTPSVNDLHSMVHDDRYKKLMDASKMNNRANFTVDQLAAILLLWGRDHGVSLQLGWSVSGCGSFLVPQNNSAPPTVIWIHNDNAEAEFCAIGHWSGLKPKLPSAAKAPEACDSNSGLNTTATTSQKAPPGSDQPQLVETISAKVNKTSRSVQQESQASHIHPCSSAKDANYQPAKTYMDLKSMECVLCQTRFQTLRTFRAHELQSPRHQQYLQEPNRVLLANSLLRTKTLMMPPPLQRPIRRSPGPSVREVVEHLQSSPILGSKDTGHHSRGISLSSTEFYPSQSVDDEDGDFSD